MVWLDILKLILGIGSSLTNYLEDKRLIDTGTALALKVNYGESLEAIRKAQRARDNVVNDADGLRDDRNNRD